MCGKCTSNPGTCPDYNSIYLRENSAGSNGGGISSCLLGNNDANPFCWEGQSCSSWGEHAISGFSSSSTNACKDNSCAISAPTWNGEACTVRKAIASGVISSSNGKWDDSETKCVEC